MPRLRAPRVSSLIGYALFRPYGQLSLQRMINRAIRVCAQRDGAKLRIRYDEILRKQSAGAKSPPLMISPDG